MNIVEAASHHRKAIIQLLKSQKLPSEDLPVELDNFYVAKEGEQVIGVIGMESYESFGLLRSLVVDPDYRNKQVAEALVMLLEKQAAALGIHALFLLTETAASYFSKKGYNIIDRPDVPAVLLASSEFSHVCPVSATVMRKLVMHP